jgi:hypothetical protein
MDDLVERLRSGRWLGETTGAKAADRIEAQEAEIRSLREQVARLQAIIDSRPAINAGLPESYIKWSQSVMLTEAAQAAGVVQ